jgi:hypothetical protein
LQPHHPLYALADGSIAVLQSQNKKLYLTPQNLIDLWTVATRPVDVNDLGTRTAVTRLEIEPLERFFTVLPETPEIYPAWKRLVIQHQVVGKPAHDARRGRRAFTGHRVHFDLRCERVFSLCRH